MTTPSSVHVAFIFGWLRSQPGGHVPTMATLTRNRPCFFCALSLAAMTSAPGKPAAQEARTVDCRPVGGLVQVADIPEASGIAVGRQQRGRAWAHNDSGDPVVIALDEGGRVTGRMQVSGASMVRRSRLPLRTARGWRKSSSRSASNHDVRCSSGPGLSSRHLGTRASHS